MTDKSCNLCDRAVSSDPGISQYCAIIATKNNFRNSVGDALATRLSKLSTSLTASALNRCGLSVSLFLPENLALAFVVHPFYMISAENIC